MLHMYVNVMFFLYYFIIIVDLQLWVTDALQVKNQDPIKSTCYLLLAKVVGTEQS